MLAHSLAGMHLLAQECEILTWEVLLRTIDQHDGRKCLSKGLVAWSPASIPDVAEVQK